VDTLIALYPRAFIVPAQHMDAEFDEYFDLRSLQNRTFYQLKSWNCNANLKNYIDSVQPILNGMQEQVFMAELLQEYEEAGATGGGMRFIDITYDDLFKRAVPELPDAPEDLLARRIEHLQASEGQDHRRATLISLLRDLSTNAEGYEAQYVADLQLSLDALLEKQDIQPSINRNDIDLEAYERECRQYLNAIESAI